MNEVKHVLTALRSPTKSSTLSNGTVGVATATWYDAPAPIIVHCREFHEEDRDVIENEESKKSCEKEIEIGSIDKNMEAGSFERPDTVVVGSSEKDKMTVERPLSFNEALYQNKETILKDRNRNRKRHSTTVELNATTMVETDADGVPTISFSFLRVDEKFNEDGDEFVILEVDTSDQIKDSAENQLYDLPKSAVPNRVSLEQYDDNETNIESSSPILYDVPKPAKDTPSNKSQEEEEEATMTLSNVSLDKKKQQRDQTKRSIRSLKSGRRSYGASDSDGYDAGIASMSGSYSDPECPNEEGSLSGGSDRSRRKLQKRRLGKAWGRMRSWLREERIRIGDIVNRHARLQAVGALSPEVAKEKEKKERREIDTRLINIS